MNDEEYCRLGQVRMDAQAALTIALAAYESRNKHNENPERQVTVPLGGLLDDLLAAVRAACSAEFMFNMYISQKADESSAMVVTEDGVQFV